MKRGNFVWFNGKISSIEESKISLFTHSLHYGVGAFEGIRAYQQGLGKGGVFRLEDHINRLFNTCKILDLPLIYSKKNLIDAVIQTCQANQFLECYIRPIVFTGDGPLGVHPGPNPPVDVAILCWEWGSYLGDGTSQGTRLKISSFIRSHVNSLMTKGKITGQYVNSVLAKREAVAQGFDEALLLDSEGFLTEGTGENLFIIEKGVVKTTSLTSILNGITRQTVIDYFKQSKIELLETRFSRDELWCADEVFLTGTAAEITPVREIDYKVIGAGVPGPITLGLQNYFHKLVRGKIPDSPKNWITGFENISPH